MKKYRVLLLITAVCLAVVAGFALLSPKAENSKPVEGTQPPATATPSPDQQESPELTAKREKAMRDARGYALQYDYEAAVQILSEPSIQSDEVTRLIADIQAQKKSLVPYEGDIKHIFFHSLIVYPEMVFKDKATPMGGYNAGFAEKAELLKILPQLYERGYVLYDLAQCFEMQGGKMVRKEILLPVGKQPLVLSVDDVAYAYGDGYAQKLMVKEDGSLVNLVKNPQGVTEEMPDGDVFGVVDAFVRKHPDFSYKGHKGTLAMTGFQGAFGFSFEDEEGQAEIPKVVSALRENGWNFASHSYTHNRDNFFGPNSKTENIKYDTEKWMRLISPFFGPTNLFLAPFGYRVQQPNLQIILDAGFQIYCTVDSRVINEVYDDYALMSRIEIGGYSMTYFKDTLNQHFFNVDEVFDAQGRPPVIG